ncbi:MAG: hypothetical protein GY830_06560 [Bacteroidetes bacterium]|nr:hypothetical protein [Bacteroidota bacterium]
MVYYLILKKNFFCKFYILSKKWKFSIYYILFLLFPLIFSCNKVNSKTPNMLSFWKRKNLINEKAIELKIKKNHERINSFQKSIKLVYGYLRSMTQPNKNIIPKDILYLIESFTRSISIMFLYNPNKLIFLYDNQFLKNIYISNDNNNTNIDIIGSENYLITNDGKTIVLWNFINDKLNKIKSENDNNRICMLDKKHMVIVNDEKSFVYDLETRNKVKSSFRKEYEPPSSISKYEKDEIIIGTKSHIEIWSLKETTPRLKKLIKVNNKITAICDTGPKVVLGGQTGNIQILDKSNLNAIFDRSIYRGPVSDIIKISDKSIVSSGKNYGEIKLIYYNFNNCDYDVVSISDYKYSYNLGYNFPIKLEFIKKQNILISADPEGKICFWEIKNICNVELFKIINIEEPVYNIYYSEFNNFPIGILDNYNIKKNKLSNKNKTTNKDSYYLKIDDESDNNEDDLIIEENIPTKTGKKKNCCIIL